MIAYRLPGTNKAYDEDYYDDGEYGGGCRLFRILLDDDAYSIMLVVIRQMGDRLIGPARFTSITNAGKEAFQKLQVNQMEKSVLCMQQRKTQSKSFRRRPKAMGIQQTSSQLPVNPGIGDPRQPLLRRNTPDTTPTVADARRARTKTLASGESMAAGITPYAAYNHFQILGGNNSRSEASGHVAMQCRDSYAAESTNENESSVDAGSEQDDPSQDELSNT